MQQQCGLTQHRIDGCAHDDAPAHWPGNNLPVGMNTGTLARGRKRHMEQLASVSCRPIRLPRWRRLLQAPIRLAGRNHPQAHPGSFGVPPSPWAEPSSSPARFIPPSPQHTSAVPALVAGLTTCRHLFHHCTGGTHPSTSRCRPLQFLRPAFPQEARRTPHSRPQVN